MSPQGRNSVAPNLNMANQNVKLPLPELKSLESQVSVGVSPRGDASARRQKFMKKEMAKKSSMNVHIYALQKSD